MSSIEVHTRSLSVAGRTLLDDTRVTAGDGRIAVVLGPSGAGKSLWLRSAAGLIAHDNPVIRFDHEVRVWSGEEPSSGSMDRPRLAVMFQTYAVLDELTPRQNVQLAIDHASPNRRPNEPSGSTSDGWLDRLGVPADVPTGLLSGGQKQRLALARTLASQPDAIFYDEPTSGLDDESGRAVVELISRVHRERGIPGIVITHDTDLWTGSISDDSTIQSVSRFDTRRRALVLDGTSHDDAWVDDPADASEPPNFVSTAATKTDRWMVQTGQSIANFLVNLIVGPLLFPVSRWSAWFTLRYLRRCLGLSAIVYLMIAGGIVGFVATYFTFRFLPYRAYTQPLLVDDLLASIGFALYRILVPILATVLVAARTGALLAADAGVKQYGGQNDALRTLGVSIRRLLLGPMTWSMLIATPTLCLVAYGAARMVSAATFTTMHSTIPPVFWQNHFDRVIDVPVSTAWVVGKCVASGWGIAAIAFTAGRRTKTSASAVGGGITATILYATLWVLGVHLVTSLYEF